MNKELRKLVQNYLWQLSTKYEEDIVDAIVKLLDISKFEAWGWLRFCALSDTGTLNPVTIEDNAIDGLMVMYDYKHNFNK